MKKYSILFGIFSVLFSSICLAKTSEAQLDLTGQNYNFHHYHLDLMDDSLILKKDHQVIVTKPTLTENIKNFTVDDIVKTKNGFTIAANWGGGENFYKTQFYFNFNKTKDYFYLTKITECGLSHATDEKKRFTIFSQQMIKPPVALTKFDFAKDYQQFYTTQPKPKITHCNVF